MALLRTLDDKIRISIDDQQTILLGRIPECDFVLDDESVSSQHARLHLEDQVLHVQDLGSTNGTRVNYTQIDETTLLLDGDTVEFGNVTFTVEASELRSPSESQKEPEAFTTLEPVSEPSDFAATMQLPDIDEVDTKEDQHNPLSLRKHAAKEGKESEDESEDKKDEPKPSRAKVSPQVIAFALSFVLLLLGLGLVLVWVGRISISF